VFHFDLYGKRKQKYQYLFENTLASVAWQKIESDAPRYFFAAKDFSNKVKYDKGFSVKDLFPVNAVGFNTHRDAFALSFNKSEIVSWAKDLRNLEISDDAIFQKYSISDNRDWNLTKARSIIQNDGGWEMKIRICTYRPFDFRYCYYSDVMMDYTRYNIMRHLFSGNNMALIAAKQAKNDFGVYLTKYVSGHKTCVAYDGNYILPLYLYPFDNPNERAPNLNKDIVTVFSEKIDLSFTSEKQDDENTFAPIDILDYIYAVLYSNNYRTKYMEFLKIDFPRVSYPENAEQFQKLSFIGSRLRNLHLMENISPIMDMADFPIPGTNEIETVYYKAEKVYINKHQYFENIPTEIWGYYIGGYQPAEKWLKDRKGRVLSFEDIEHYQKIITVLKMTIELQAQIDGVVYL
jgi:predicted helicase